MIEVRTGKIFVEGKQTIDPTLIGLAVLDSVERDPELNFKDEIK